MPALRAIRWKLFALIVGAVSAPVALTSVYLPMSRVASLERSLTRKAATLSRLLVDETRAAIAFDDSQTAREVFAAVSDDHDVLSVALFRADGTLMEAIGPAPAHAPPWTDAVRIQRSADLVQVIAPVVASEGPRGLLVMGLSTADALAEGRRSRREALTIGAIGLLLGCAAAWMVGRSFGRRVNRIGSEAARVADGDLTDRPAPDQSPDEIGELGRAFQAMVRQLQTAYAGIERQVVERTEALRASHEQNRALLETTNAVPWEMDASAGELRFTYVGPQVATMFGTPPQAWAERAAWTALLEPGDVLGATQAFEKAASEGTNQVVEFRVRRASGRPLWVRALITAVSEGGSRRLRGFMFDVTERAEMEFELRQAQKLESVGRLASGIAHEINTPVQFVSDSVHFVRDALADVLATLDRYQRLDANATSDELAGALRETHEAAETADLGYFAENAPQALERAIEGLARVATIVRSMKQFAHPDAQGKAPADLNSALESTLIIARNEYKEVADVQTRFGELPFVNCHIGELNQAFLNIVVNAAHAIGDVSKARGNRGLITVATRREGEEAVVEIGDTGGGIPPEVQPRIFDPFFTTKEVGRGTGQGLAIAHRSVVEKHGGALTFHTEVGQGTTFVIRVPLSGDATAPASAAAS